MIVWDRWWPHRLGRLVKRTKTTARVLWSDGETWKYDRDHLKFLETRNGPLVKR